MQATCGWSRKVEIQIPVLWLIAVFLDSCATSFFAWLQPSTVSRAPHHPTYYKLITPTSFGSHRRIFGYVNEPAAFDCINPHVAMMHDWENIMFLVQWPNMWRMSNGGRRESSYYSILVAMLVEGHHWRFDEDLLRGISSRPEKWKSVHQDFGRSFSSIIPYLCRMEWSCRWFSWILEMQSTIAFKSSFFIITLLSPQYSCDRPDSCGCWQRALSSVTSASGDMEGSMASSFLPTLKYSNPFTSLSSSDHKSEKTDTGEAITRTPINMAKQATHLPIGDVG